MSKLNLVCLNFDDCSLLSQIKSHLCEFLPTNIPSHKEINTPDEYYNQDRQQYDAGRIIEAFDKEKGNKKTILITSLDLYIPIFTFVFGLAKLNGSTAIVSAHRLRSEFYGLPVDDDLLKTRLIKEVVHELGHLLNLRHCNDYRCVMASSNSADDLDIKGDRFCVLCLNKLETG
jgi:archaemetzincin